MAIIMTQTVRGSANQYGNETRMYNEGEEIIIDAPWKQALADNFLRSGLAKETKVVEPTSTGDDAPVAAENGVKSTIKKAISPKRGRPKKSSD